MNVQTEAQAQATDEKPSASQWKRRIVLSIPLKQFRKLKRGARTLVMKDTQLYEIRAKKKAETPDITLANGKKLTKARLIRLLKQFA